MAFHLEDILRMWEKKITSFCAYIGLFFFATWKSCMVLTSLPLFFVLLLSLLLSYAADLLSAMKIRVCS